MIPVQQVDIRLEPFHKRDDGTTSARIGVCPRVGAGVLVEPMHEVFVELPEGHPTDRDSVMALLKVGETSARQWLDENMPGWREA